MTASLYTLHIVDDFGNQIPPYELTAYMNRYNYFKDHYE